MLPQLCYRSWAAMNSITSLVGRSCWLRVFWLEPTMDGPRWCCHRWDNSWVFARRNWIVITLLVQYYVCSSLRRYPLCVVMWKFEMGAHRSPGCVDGGNYCGEEEEGESDQCSNPSFSHIRIICPFTLMITPIVGWTIRRILTCHFRLDEHGG